jgi:pimeloyl-ACP methyl ester carboxylesterase
MAASKPDSLGSDAVGFGRLAFDAMFGLTSVVESMHGTIAERPLPFGGAARADTRGITRLVYQSIRAVTHLVGGGFDILTPLLLAQGDAGLASLRRDAVVAALNGVIGDHLVATGNPLAIPMRFRRDGGAIELAPDAIAALSPTSRVVVLVGGVCMSERLWKRQGHDHGELLARELGFTPLYLHYNSGRHISTNGREFADRLAELCEAWPVPLEQLVIVGHSMGGLVTRSACHHARLAGQRWLERLKAIVLLGSPHHGAPLERAGNLLELLLGISPYAAPLARLGRSRSAGVNDLRFGNLLDDDWDGQKRGYREDPRTPVPLPDGVSCFAVAGKRDKLVPVASALGQHREPRRTLAFPPAHQLVVPDSNHFDLLDAPAVQQQLLAWLGARP